MEKIVSIFLISSLLILLSCSGDERYAKSELVEMAVKEDPKATLIVPDKIDEGIKCEDYGPGCIGGFMARVRMVRIVLVEFESEEQAMKDAQRLGQYYARNWLFDNVTGEPVLESFVKKVYGAKQVTAENN